MTEPRTRSCSPNPHKDWENRFLMFCVNGSAALCLAAWVIVVAGMSETRSSVLPGPLDTLRGMLTPLIVATASTVGFVTLRQLVRFFGPPQLSAGLIVEWRGHIGPLMRHRENIAAVCQTPKDRGRSVICLSADKVGGNLVPIVRSEQQMAWHLTRQSSEHLILIEPHDPGQTFVFTIQLVPDSSSVPKTQSGMQFVRATSRLDLLAAWSL